MTRTLLTGGSGFIAAHVLAELLKHGHSVVTTVRSQAKADKIREAHPNATKSQLDFAIVEDIAQPGAFDEAVKADPPFEAVIHTASPFHFNATDIQKELLDPAIIGTTGILKSIKASAPTVKRVVITSSFASIVNPSKGLWPGHTYTEKDWSPLTHEEALQNPSSGYRASKKFAEQAAWAFVEKEKPEFSITTMCPPLVFGPVEHHLSSLESLNTSNMKVRDSMQGAWKDKDELPDTGVYLWIDVRDLAEAHVKAMEVPEAANQRFFVTAGHYSNKELLDVLRKNLPEIASKLPPANIKGGTLPSEMYQADTSHAAKILGIKYHSFESTITDTAKSLQKLGA